MANLFCSAATGADGDNGTTEALAKETIQGAIDVASSGDVIWIKNDGVYEISSAIDITDGLLNITFVGYNTTYHATNPFLSDLGPTGSSYRTDWSVINAAGGHRGFQWNSGSPTADAEKYSFLNLKLTGFLAAGVNEPIYFESGVNQIQSVLVQNCFFTGGNNMNLPDVIDFKLIDCKVTGTWYASKPVAAIFNNICYNGLIYGNFFQPTATDACVDVATLSPANDFGLTICHNVFTVSEAGVIDNALIETHHGASIFNNVFYEPSGATIAAAIFIGAAAVTTLQGYDVWNNIIQSDALSPMESINNAEGFLRYSDYNCIYNCDNTNYTSMTNDIEKDPQFRNAAAYDFRLSNLSPCSTAGKPMVAGDGVYGRSPIGTAMYFTQGGSRITGGDRATK